VARTLYCRVNDGRRASLVSMNEKLGQLVSVVVEPRGGQFCVRFGAHLSSLPKNYRNRTCLNKVIAKIKRCKFLPYSVIWNAERSL